MNQTLENPEAQSDSAEQSHFSEADHRVMRAMLAKLKAGKDLRQDKIRRLKKAIASDDYENTLKLEVTIDRVSEEIDDRPATVTRIARTPRPRRTARPRQASKFRAR